MYIFSGVTNNKTRKKKKVLPRHPRPPPPHKQVHLSCGSPPLPLEVAWNHQSTSHTTRSNFADLLFVCFCFVPIPDMFSSSFCLYQRNSTFFLFVFFSFFPPLLFFLIINHSSKTLRRAPILPHSRRLLIFRPGVFFFFSLSSLPFLPCTCPARSCCMLKTLLVLPQHKLQLISLLSRTVMVQVKLWQHKQDNLTAFILFSGWAPQIFRYSICSSHPKLRFFKGIFFF